MIGVILVAISEVFAESSASVGKYEVQQKKESLYALGFLSAFWATVFLFIIAVLKDGSFVFVSSGLPIFLSRAVLEIFLLFIALNAVLQADRSTFAFLRILTIPLLLVVDTALGYQLSTQQLLGIGIMVATLALLFTNHGLSARGKILSLLSAILAVGTISLYKYNITHHNSVVAEQLLMHLLIVLSLIIVAKWRIKENLFKYLLHPVFLGQSLLAGIANVSLSFAYLFAPASIITTAKRAFEILASITSGRTFFHEKHLVVKIISFGLILSGTILLIV